MNGFMHSIGVIQSTPDHVRIGDTIGILDAIHETEVNLAIWQRGNLQHVAANTALASPDLYKKDGTNFKKSKVEFNIKRGLSELPLVDSHLKDQCDLDLRYLYPKRAELVETFFRLFPNVDMVRYESRIIGPSAPTMHQHSFHVDRDPFTVSSKSESILISTDIGEQATEWLPSDGFTLAQFVDAYAENASYVAIPENTDCIRRMGPDDVGLMWPGDTIHNGLYHKTPDRNPRALMLLYAPLLSQRNNPRPLPFYDRSPS
jgi:hypothetical protein